MSLDPSAAEIAIHEMGHTAFGFADEYEYYLWLHDAARRTATSSHRRRACRAECDDQHELGHHQVVCAAHQCYGRAAYHQQCDLRSVRQIKPIHRAARLRPESMKALDIFIAVAIGRSSTARCAPSANHSAPSATEVIRNTLAPFLPAESIVLTTPSIAFTNVPEGLWWHGRHDFSRRRVRSRHVRDAHVPDHLRAHGGFGTPRWER